MYFISNVHAEIPEDNSWTEFNEQHERAPKRYAEYICKCYLRLNLIVI